MKKIILILCFSLLIIGNLFGQSKGFGFTTGIDMVSLISSFDGGSGNIMPTIYYINKTPTATWEPSFSYYKTSRTYTDYNNYGEVAEYDVSNSIITVGFGYLKPNYSIDNFTSYWGARLSYTILNVNMDCDGCESDDDSQMAIAPIYGAEYYFGNHFSVGGELRFNIILPSEEDESDTQTMYTSTALLFRFYK